MFGLPQVAVGIHTLVLLPLIGALLGVVLMCQFLFASRRSGLDAIKPEKHAAFVNLKDLPEGQQDFVVFLIGFRINSWPKLVWHQRKAVMRFGRHALATFDGFSRTANHKEGCLGSTVYGSILGGETMTVQYWRSFEDLWKFSINDRHNASFAQYYRELFEGGIIGIWHEAYRVRGGDYENVYVNMGPHLLSSLKADDISYVEVDGKTRKSKTRLEHGKLF